MIGAFAHILVAYMVLLMPWIGRFKYRKLQDCLAAGIPDARLRFYRLSAAQQALLVGLVLLYARLAALPWHALGLAAPYSWAVARALLITFAIAIGFSIVLFRRTGDRFLRRLLKMAGALIPAMARERVWFAGLSLGAGISEELLFRGFLLWYLSFFFPQLNRIQLIVLSSLLFGFCHVYQGWMGIVGTGVMGAVFAWLYLSTASLLLPMAIHALVDLRLLAILTPGRMQSLQPRRPKGNGPELERAGPSVCSG
jgi:membrane protease YdiL (CAAX protease family)